MTKAHWLRSEIEKFGREFHHNYFDWYDGEVAVTMSEMDDFTAVLLTTTKAHWLRSEIEKLEIEVEHWKKHSSGNYAEGAIEALTSIITRYKEELKVLENVEQYKCKSYFDENNTLQDCTCKKCS